MCRIFHHAGKTHYHHRHPALRPWRPPAGNQPDPCLQPTVGSPRSAARSLATGDQLSPGSAGTLADLEMPTDPPGQPAEHVGHRWLSLCLLCASLLQRLDGVVRRFGKARTGHQPWPVRLWHCVCTAGTGFPTNKTCRRSLRDLKISRAMQLIQTLNRQQLDEQQFARLQRKLDKPRAECPSRRAKLAAGACIVLLAVTPFSFSTINLRRLARSANESAKRCSPTTRVFICWTSRQTPLPSSMQSSIVSILHCRRLRPKKSPRPFRAPATAPCRVCWPPN